MDHTDFIRGFHLAEGIIFLGLLGFLFIFHLILMSQNLSSIENNYPDEEKKKLNRGSIW